MRNWFLILSLCLVSGTSLAAQSTGTSAEDDLVPVYNRMNPERILLTPEQVEVAVAELTGWVVEAGHLKKTFVCRNFTEAVAFIVAFSYACERIDHHPEIRNIYHRVAISITSYDAGAKISTHDIELAKQIDAVAGAFVK